MQWFYSASVGSSGNGFPSDILRIKLAEKLVESIDPRQRFYPTDGELGVLASIVYEEHKAFPAVAQSNLTRTERIALEGKLLEEQEKRLPAQLLHFFEQWSCVFRFKEEKSGYSGAVYIHQTLPQLVIVNEGTRTKAHMMADVVEIASSTVGENTEASAAADLLQKIKPVLEAFPYYAISITGHSLGGWLSLVSTLEAAKLGLRVHTVAFDSPGVMPMLGKRRHDVSSDIGLASLDIRTILSSVNVVNVCHSHAPGTIRVFPNLEGITDKVKYILESHSIRNILEVFDGQGQIRDNQYRIVDNWPSITPIKKDISDRSLLRLTVRAVQNISDAEVRESLGNCKAFFDYCEGRFNQYHSPELGLALLDQGELDGMAYGRVHYKTSPANPFCIRIAYLNQNEQDFLKFMLVSRPSIPKLKEWFVAKNYGTLFDLLTLVSLDEQPVFQVLGEKDPQIIIKDQKEEYKPSLNQLINDIHQFIRQYPNAVLNIQTEFHDYLQETRNKAEAALAQQQALPDQVRQWIEEHLNQLLPNKNKPVITNVKTAMFARRDAYDEEEIYEFSSDEALRQSRMDMARLKEEYKQKSSEEQKTSEPLVEDGLTLDAFQEFINNVTENKNIDRLIVGMRDAYSRRTQLTVRKNQPINESNSVNP